MQLGTETPVATRAARGAVARPFRARHYLAGIALLALALRLIGIAYGLPEIYTSDNETSFVWPAITINRTGSLHPSFFGHPGSTVIYAFAFLIQLLFRAQQWLGFDPSFAAFEQRFWADPTDVFLLVRAFTAALGTLVVLVTYLVARPLVGRRAALVGALLVAVAPHQHQWSQLARTDIPATLFALLTTWAALQLLQTGRARWYAAAGAFAGLALATKYPAVIALIAPAAAHLARWRLGRAGLADRRVLLTGLAWLVAFLGSSPYLILDRWGALRDLTAEFELGHLGADRLPGVGNDLWYLYSALPAAAGWPTYLLGLVGLVLASRRDRPRQLVFAAFPAVYLAVVTSGTTRWAHWTLPVVPYLAAWAGLALTWLVGRLGLRRTALVGAAVLVAAWPLGIGLAHDYRALLTDTRTEAAGWYAAHLPPGARVAFELYAGRAPPTVRADTPGLIGNRPLAAWRDDGYDYLVFSDWMYGRVYAEPEKFGPEIALYEEMFAGGRLLAEFDPCVLDCWLGRRGPTIRVVQIR
ncbi:MAG TPA: glycosyltransferase family 39 protein [Chloroflexota bacterium]|nr:glycosyltransferase family 39 protein [Chloroflexota bacterium]